VLASAAPRENLPLSHRPPPCWSRFPGEHPTLVARTLQSDDRRAHGVIGRSCGVIMEGSKRQPGHWRSSPRNAKRPDGTRCCGGPSSPVTPINPTSTPRWRSNSSRDLLPVGEHCVERAYYGGTNPAAPSVTGFRGFIRWRAIERPPCSTPPSARQRANHLAT